MNTSMKTPKKCYIGLGSNLENPISQIKTAIQELAALPKTSLTKSSSLYQTPPLPPVLDQPDFINAVVEIETALEAEQLLAALQAIEQAHERVQSKHWGPRTLDLDLLLYGDEALNKPHITVPHPELTKRSFVLYPLVEISPEVCLPTGIRIADLLGELPQPTKPKN